MSDIQKAFDLINEAQHLLEIALDEQRTKHDEFEDSLPDEPTDEEDDELERRAEALSELEEANVEIETAASRLEGLVS